MRAMAAFLEFCYLARRAYLTDTTLAQMDAAWLHFHQYRVIFQMSGVRPDGFSLPCQHSINYYPQHIHNFGAPNGLCTSITKAKHIKAIKEPWRHLNHYEALGQMLVTNQHNEKLAAAQADFSARGMLTGTCLSATIEVLRQAMSDLEDDCEHSDPNQETGNDPNYKDDPYEDPPDDDEDGNDDNDDHHDDGDDGDDADNHDDRGGEPAPQRGGDQDLDGVISRPRVSGFIVLAHKPCKCVHQYFPDCLRHLLVLMPLSA